MGIPAGTDAMYYRYTAYCEFPGHKGGYDEPRKEFKNGIMAICGIASAINLSCYISFPPAWGYPNVTRVLVITTNIYGYHEKVCLPVRGSVMPPDHLL